MDNQVEWRLLVRPETGKEQAVRVRHDEALAIRIDPDAVVGRSEETAKVFAEAMQKCPDGADARG